MSDEKSAGTVLSENFRRAAGLPERESNEPVDLSKGPSEITNAQGPEGGYGGDPDYTSGVNSLSERRPGAATDEEVEVREGPPNPPEGQAHNMSSGEWPADASVSPVATDDPKTGVGEPLETPTSDSAETEDQEPTA